MFFHHEAAIQLQHPVLTPDEIEEVMLLLQSGEDEPVASPNSGSDEGSNQGSGLTDSGSMDEERKRKRMVSNRESARRSRWRKRRHLEDLTSDADRLSKENRELTNRLGLVANRCLLMRRENEQLRSESVALWAILSDLHRIFMTIHTMSN